MRKSAVIIPLCLNAVVCSCSTNKADESAALYCKDCYSAVYSTPVSPDTIPYIHPDKPPVDDIVPIVARYSIKKGSYLDIELDGHDTHGNDTISSSKVVGDTDVIWVSNKDHVTRISALNYGTALVDTQVSNGQVGSVKQRIEVIVT